MSRDTLRDYHFVTTLARDTFGMIAGDEIASGVYRRVYACNLNVDHVVKFEESARDFCNVREWDIWQRVKETKLARWFAPCVAISPSGIALIQQRCKPVTLPEMPKKVPGFFTDLKVENWGRYQDRVVCLDYGNHLMLEKGMDAKLKIAKWWISKS